MSTLKVYNGTTWDTLSGVGLSNPMTTEGSMIIGGINGTPTELLKGTDGQVLTLASGNPAWATSSGGSGSLLIAETVVSGSAVSSVTFSGLDGNTTGGYFLEWIVKGVANQAWGNAVFRINNDATGGNYRKVNVVMYDGASISGNIASSPPDIDWNNNNTSGLCIGTCSFLIGSLGIGGSFVRQFHDTAGSRDFLTSGTYRYAVTTNITSINIVCNSGSLDVGSTFRLFKRK